MAEKRRLRHESHGTVRAVMRVVGPLLILAGGAMFVMGIISFTGSFDERPSLLSDPFRELVPGAEPEPPNRFWMCFVGMPVAMAGIFLTRFGFLGAAARYVAGETAPVATDAINYVVDGTKESIREVAGAVRGEYASTASCPSCGTGNDTGAKFCDECGTSLAHACPQCNESNDADAKFCDACGARL